MQTLRQFNDSLLLTEFEQGQQDHQPVHAKEGGVDSLTMAFLLKRMRPLKPKTLIWVVKVLLTTTMR